MSYALSVGPCASIISGLTIQGVDSLGGTIACEMGQNYANASATIPAKSGSATYATNLSVLYWTNGQTYQVPLTVYYQTATGTVAQTNSVDENLAAAVKEVGSSALFWSLLMFSIVVGLVINMAGTGVSAFAKMFDNGE